MLKVKNQECGLGNENLFYYGNNGIKSSYLRVNFRDKKLEDNLFSESRRKRREDDEETWIDLLSGW